MVIAKHVILSGVEESPVYSIVPKAEMKQTHLRGDVFGHSASRASQYGLQLPMNRYFVYVMANRSGTLYIGVTNNLRRRVFEHKHKLIPGFTRKYGLNRLIYFETTSDIHGAISREKQLKDWTRQKKLDLVSCTNPALADLSKDW